jgi:type IV pilus assembly protein PilV
MRALDRHLDDGTTLVEVLVTMIILSIGLLGLVGLQGRLQVLQIESYQRAQALLLLDDMASRLASNRYAAPSYVTTSPLGAGTTCPVLAGTPTRQERDATEWCDALQGAGEQTGGGTRVGAMAGGRGCVESLGSGDYLITVAWQGLAPLATPPAGVTCGSGSYDATGTPCTGDLCRRVVTTVVRIPTL